MSSNPTTEKPSEKKADWMDRVKKVLFEIVRIDSVKRDPRREYPETVQECIDDEMKYKKGVYDAVKTFRDTNPWKGTKPEMQGKFQALNATLAKIYGIHEPKLVFVDQFPMGPCCFPTSVPAVIMMEATGDDRYSVVAYLHEFAHAIGNDERGACRWSLNLFKRYFPGSYNKLEPRGHMLYRKENEDAGNPEGTKKVKTAS